MSPIEKVIAVAEVLERWSKKATVKPDWRSLKHVAALLRDAIAELEAARASEQTP